MKLSSTYVLLLALIAAPTALGRNLRGGPSGFGEVKELPGPNHGDHDHRYRFRFD